MQKKIHIFFLWFVWQFFCGAVLFAQPTNALSTAFAQAKRASDSGNTAEAIRLYNSLLSANQQKNAVLEYNIANTYYKNKELGKAILHAERALALAPNDADITNNLSFLRAQCRDDIVQIDEFFLVRWLRRFCKFLATDTWATLGIFCLWAFGAGGLVWIFGRTREWKQRGFLYANVALLVSILPFSLAYWQQKTDTDSGYGVVIITETALRSAPDMESSDVLKIHEGLKVSLLDVIGEWRKVGLPNGEEGWILGVAVEKM